MKKIISLFLIIAILVSCVAFAEETFTIHNGVTFGMEKQQVREIEESAGFKYGIDSVMGKVAGQDNTTIMFYYNNDGTNLEYYNIPLCGEKGLNKCVYKFCMLGGNPASVHSSMLDALTKKYGAPMYESATELLSFEKELCGNTSCSWSANASSAFSNVYQWLIPYYDTSILIELNREKSGGTLFSKDIVNIVYMVLPPEALVEYSDAQQQILDDL